MIVLFGLLPTVDAFQFVKESFSLVFIRSYIGAAKIKYGDEGEDFVVISNGLNIRRCIVKPNAEKVANGVYCGNNDNAYKSRLGVSLCL